MTFHHPRLLAAAGGALSLLLHASHASAEVFHYTDRTGRTHSVDVRPIHPALASARDAAPLAAAPPEAPRAPAWDTPAAPGVPAPDAVAVPGVPAPQAFAPPGPFAAPNAALPPAAPAAPPVPAPPGGYPDPFAGASHDPQTPLPLFARAPSPELVLPVVPTPRERAAPIPFLAITQEAAALYSLPVELLLAVIKVESNFNPAATSRRGAHGLMQLMPTTAAELGVSDPFDPRQNIFAGARYLRLLVNDFDGQVSLAVAAYNAGAGAVRRAGGIPPIPETQGYVPAVLAAYHGYRAAAERLQRKDAPW